MPPTLRSIKRRSHPDTSSESSGLMAPGVQASEGSLDQDVKIESLQENLEGQNSESPLEEKKSNKRIKYQKASFSLRAKLVQMVDTEGFSIRQAAKQLNLKYSTAKCIYKLFVDESRLGTTRISKEALLSTKIEQVEQEHDDSENADSEVEHVRDRAITTKRVKKDLKNYRPLMDEETGATNRDFDEKSHDTTNKDMSSPSSQKLHRDDSMQTDSTTTATTPVADNKVNGSPGGISPVIVSYVPQVYQNTLVLIPIKIRTMDMDNSSMSYEAKALQAQHTASLYSQPLMINLKGEKDGEWDVGAGLNLGNVLRKAGLNILQ